MRPNSGKDNHFTHNVYLSGEFTLDDDITSTPPSSVTLYGSLTKQHRVTLQGVANGYEVEDIECNRRNDVSVQVERRRLDFVVTEDELICTFIVVGKSNVLN